MRAAIFLCLTFLICPFLMLIAPSPTATMTPTVTPASAIPDPHVEISANHTTIHVGEMVTITGIPVNIGLAIYTLKLSSGGSAHVRYDNQARTIVADDGLFEFVAMQASMGEVTFTLRARASGSSEVSISATGEIHDPVSGAFMWSGGGSPNLTITVQP